MQPNNQLVQKKKPFSVAIQGDMFKKLINNTLKDPKRAARFTTAITSAVANTPALQECEPASILSSALLGESLNLSPSPQLGQYYMVPYKKKDRSGNVLSVTAQFQMGYKGYIQLAIRSGQYKKLNVLAIKEGELNYFDPLTEDISVNLIQDDRQREQAKTVGYYAMFEYVNGFRKAIYWSYEKMLAHADRYSQAFNAQAYEDLQVGKIPQKDMWKYSSFWYKEFDAMAYKTLIRQLISKWGIMSIEMQDAFEKEVESEKTTYVDSAEPEEEANPLDEPATEQEQTESAHVLPEDETDPLA